MKIMNKKQFLETPNGTVFALFKAEWYCEDLQIKTGYCQNYDKPQFNGTISVTPSSPTENGFGYDGVPSIVTEYESHNDPIDTSDIDFDDDALFAVFDKSEIQRIIDVLKWAISEETKETEFKTIGYDLCECMNCHEQYQQSKAKLFTHCPVCRQKINK